LCEQNKEAFDAAAEYGLHHSGPITEINSENATNLWPNPCADMSTHFCVSFPGEGPGRAVRSVLNEIAQLNYLKMSNWVTVGGTAHTTIRMCDCQTVYRFTATGSSKAKAAEALAQMIKEYLIEVGHLVPRKSGGYYYKAYNPYG